MTLFPCMTLHAHRIRPTQITALFGLEVEKCLQGGYASFHGGRFQPALTLLIYKTVYILHLYFSPRLGTYCHKLTQITDIILVRAAIWKSPPQVSFKFIWAFFSVHLASPGTLVYLLETNSV